MAVRFSGSTQYYSATTGLPTSTTYTIVCWVYLSVDTNTYADWCEVRQSTSTGQPALYAGTDTDGTTPQISTNGSSSLNSTSSGFVVGQWAKVAVTVNGNSVAIFVGPNLGTLVKSTATFSGLPATFAQMHIGGDENGTFLNGRLAGFKMWTSVLTDTEIAAEFTQFQPVKSSTLRRYHRFSSASTTDNSGNGFTLTGGTGATTEADPAGVPEVAVTSVSASDSGTGTDNITVDKTLIANPSESATGTDTPSVFRDSTVFAETATGTESVTVDVLTPLSISDSGTGTDNVARAFFVDNPLGETSTGTDNITVDRTTYLTPSDAGSADDALSLRQDKTPSDAATGSEVITALRMPVPSELATCTDDVSVLNIPFTQVVRRDPALALALYDLVVLARIPQSSTSPAYIEIDPIEWKTLTYVNELSSPQSLTATAQLSSITEGVLQRLRDLASLATELRLYRNGQVVFQGPLLGWQTSGETLTLNAGGLLSYLKLMVVQSDLVYTNVDQATIVKGLVDQWQSATYGDFGIDTSAIAPVGVTRTVTYKQTELKNVFTTVTDLGKLDQGFDIEVDPASRKLTLWSPSKGVDRSTGEDAIVFDDRNVTSSDITCSVAIGDLASDAFGTGTASGTDTPFYATAVNTELRSKYGKSAVTATFSNVSTQADCQGLTNALLNARGQAFVVPGPKVRVTPDASLSSYGVGDTVSYDLGGVIAVSGAFRIRKQTITASPTGQETVDIEFV